MSGEHVWPNHLTRHRLDLLETFCGHAAGLLQAAAAGVRTHHAANVPESGEPFERTFRNLLSGSLPPSFQVSPGFFFDKNWDLSPQQDLMICDVKELVQFPPASDLNQRYVPLTCVHCFGQLKNSATKPLLTSALNQSANTIETYHAMRAASVQDRLGRPYQEPPLSVLAFARGGNTQLVDSVLRDFSRPLPNYILLVEPGIVYSRRPNPELWTEDEVSFIDHRQGGSLYACQPRGVAQEKLAGAAVLWTVFAILAKLNFDRGNNLAMAPLIYHVERQHPLVNINPAVT